MWEILDLIDFSLPLYMKEGKNQLIIAFGCTGGKHRSVLFAQKMAEHFKEKKMAVFIEHRDIEKFS